MRGLDKETLKQLASIYQDENEQKGAFAKVAGWYCTHFRRLQQFLTST
jgi:hypothetical protein